MKEENEVFKVELTAEECVGIQNLLLKLRGEVCLIPAFKEIDRLLYKFMNPKSLQD